MLDRQKNVFSLVPFYIFLYPGLKKLFIPSTKKIKNKIKNKNLTKFHGNGADIRINWEIQFLPYAGFLYLVLCFRKTFFYFILRSFLSAKEVFALAYITNLFSIECYLVQKPVHLTIIFWNFIKQTGEVPKARSW